MKKIIVLAGSRKEFEHWRLSEFRPNTELIYADKPEKLYGTKADSIEIVGTFWEREDAGKLKELADSRILTSPAPFKG